MSGSWPFKTVGRLIAVASMLVLGLLILSGCNSDGYSDDLAYPVRSDWIVITTPDIAPTHFDPPGVMPLSTLSLPKEKVTGDNLKLRGLVEKKTILDVGTITPAQRQQFEAELNKLFGTPANPKVEGKIMVDGEEKPIAQVTELRLDAATLKEGSRLYRHQCLHCHGLTGDGKGPTGPWVNPHPRDYRQGIFKFTSTTQSIGTSRKARREDLLRTMREGLENTSMPSFGLLPTEDLEKMASYVIHLALRGEVEFDVMKVMLQNDGQLDPETDVNIANALQRRLTVFAGRWLEAQTPEKKVVPAPYPYTTDEQRRASIKRGMGIFNNPNEGGCVACHKDYGRQSPYYYDAWGTIVRPTNFTAGTFRGGRRPIDLYWRAHSGINGAGMTNFADPSDPLRGLGPRTEADGTKIDTLWDVVNFIQILPYPDQRKHYGIDLDRTEHAHR